MTDLVKHLMYADYKEDDPKMQCELTDMPCIVLKGSCLTLFTPTPLFFHV